MKKTIIFIFTILAFVLTSCSKHGEAADDRETTASGKEAFTISYELGGAASHFTDMPSKASAGDIVEIKTDILIDADIHVYVDEREIDKSHYDSDYWGYSFVMPFKDVKVSARFYTKEEIWGTTADKEASLREKFPEYFDLPTDKGLEVYVWQITPSNFSFGLLSGTNREKSGEELLAMKAASAKEMREIISSYDIESKNVVIIPWQNPISSYIPECFIYFDGEEPGVREKRAQAYIHEIYDMLFENVQPDVPDDF